LSTDAEQRLTDGLAELGAPADPAVVAALLRYLALLRTWNRAYNLTRITGLEDMVVRHVLDSASARAHLAGSTVLDAGTGAGLPGMPLAVLDPARRFTLLDATGKKINFLHQAVMELRLSNVTLARARLEQWQSAQSFDTVICRALGTLAEFIALCGRFLAPAGRLVAMKGRRPVEELRAVSAPWRVATVERVTVPGLAAVRHIVVLER
jgi:16S rRNA (guanine527-N7)-methyltransferase